MIPMFSPAENLEQLRYKYLAYIVIRDALGFYFGIPKFLNSFDKDEIIEQKLQLRIGNSRWPVSEKQIDSYRANITKVIDNRLKVLHDDLDHSEWLLLNDNLWLQLLGIDPEFFKSYLPKLSEHVKDSLAVIPSWRERDEELRRPYQQSEYTPKDFKFK